MSEEKLVVRIRSNRVGDTTLHCSDGSAHMLTLWEKLMLKAGLTTATALDKKHRYQDQQG